LIRNSLLVVLDLLAIPLVFLISYSIKFKLGLVYNIIFDSTEGLIYSKVQIEPYFENIVIIIFFWIFSLLLMKGYKAYSGVLAIIDQFISICKAATLATIIVGTITLIIPLIPYSQYVFLYAWIFGILFLQLNRIVVEKILGFDAHKPQSACVIGHSNQAQQIVERLIVQKNKEFNYVGSIVEKEFENILFSIKTKLKTIGNYSEIDHILLEQNIKNVFVVVPDFNEKNIDHLVTFCEIHNINIFIHYSQSQALSGVSMIYDLSGIPVITYQKISLNNIQKVIKRLIDIVVSVMALVILSPYLLMVAAWIKIVSPQGPIIYQQKRVGFLQKEFTLYKFRTMTIDQEAKSGPAWTVNNKSASYIYGGKWLRRYSIDELPQLVNIIKNEMSLIGPRPERKYFVDQISQEAPYFNLRHNIKGGLTGWAQIHGRAYLTNRPLEKFRYDLHYIKNWSLSLDLKILLKTIVIVKNAEEVY